MNNISISQDIRPRSDTGIAIWISALILTIFLIVVVGGITRLTESGLSIVEWRPVTGVLPPLNEGQWLAEFQKYQDYPEFQKVNSHFELSDFKFIYFWEYLHRLLARLVGVLLFFPWMYFAVKKRFDFRQNLMLFGAFLLGGGQGFLGWYMVKSGLIDRPDVSHFRLAAHLGLALFIMGYLFWFLLNYLNPSEKKFETNAREVHPHRKWAISLLLVVCLQIIYGAFTAGLDAGKVYNTFPKMGETWVAPYVFSEDSFLFNITHNPIAIQFIHRWLGLTIFASVWGIFLFLKPKAQTLKARLAFRLVFLATHLQVALGILTLLFAVPVNLGVIHQAGAVILMLLNLFWIFSLGEVSEKGDSLEFLNSKNVGEKKMKLKKIWVGLFAPLILFGFSQNIWAFGRLSTPKEAGMSAKEVPKEMQEVGIEEHLGAGVDLNLPFTDHQGNQVRLGDYFDGETPVLMALVYYTCPNLCNLHLNGVVNSLKDLKWKMGQEYRFVVISIDPNDTPETAKAKRENYLAALGVTDPGDRAWPFLLGPQSSIDQIAREVGFKYKWDEESEQWVHTAAAYVLTPEGTISFYHYGVAPTLSSLRLSLVDAAKKKIGTIVDRVALFCLRYDPNKKNYSFYVLNIVRVISALFALGLALYLFQFWRRSRLVG